MIALDAIGWDHPRCVGPMRACGEEWRARTGVAIEWQWRSLEAFGDQSLEELAPEFDLLVIDHPFCGTAAATGCLRALDELLPGEVLAALAGDSIGASHASYSYGGHQWAFATDAACQVAAARDDLIDPPPVTWEEVLSLAEQCPGQVALPLAPAHAISSFLTLCANAGETVASSPSRLVDRTIGERAVTTLVDLYRLGPREATRWEPPEALFRLTSTNELLYIPLTYGYVTYARAGDVARPCRFVNIPDGGLGPVGAVLGGAGIAVGAGTGHPAEGAAFAAWVSEAHTQSSIVAAEGGQPASRTAWDDPEIDAANGGFYSGTTVTMEHAWVRPRDPWWPRFQLDGGRLLTRALEDGDRPTRVCDALESLYGTIRDQG